MPLNLNLLLFSLVLSPLAFDQSLDLRFSESVFAEIGREYFESALRASCCGCADFSFWINLFDPCGRLRGCAEEGLAVCGNVFAQVSFVT